MEETEVSYNCLHVCKNKINSISCLVHILMYLLLASIPVYVFIDKASSLFVLDVLAGNIVLCMHITSM